MTPTEKRILAAARYWYDRQVQGCTAQGYEKAVLDLYRELAADAAARKRRQRK